MIDVVSFPYKYKYIIILPQNLLTDLISATKNATLYKFEQNKAKYLRKCLIQKVNEEHFMIKLILVISHTLRTTFLFLSMDSIITQLTRCLLCVK